MARELFLVSPTRGMYVGNIFLGRKKYENIDRFFFQEKFSAQIHTNILFPLLNSYVTGTIKTHSRNISLIILFA